MPVRRSATRPQRYRDAGRRRGVGRQIPLAANQLLDVAGDDAGLLRGGARQLGLGEGDHVAEREDVLQPDDAQVPLGPHVSGRQPRRGQVSGEVVCHRGDAVAPEPEVAGERAPGGGDDAEGARLAGLG